LKNVQLLNQDKGKEISRIPRFILVRSSSRATFSLFVN